MLPIQEESNSLVLWSFWIHYKNSKDIEYVKPIYTKLIQRAANFLLRLRDPDTPLPVTYYDLWEERY